MSKKIRIRLPTNHNFGDSHRENLQLQEKSRSVGLNTVSRKNDLSEIKKHLPEFSICSKKLEDKERFDNLIMSSYKRNDFDDDSEVVLDARTDSEDNVYFQTGLYVGRLYIGDFIIDIEARNGDVLFERMLNYANNIFIEKDSGIAKKDPSAPSTFPLFEYLFLLSLQKSSVLGFPQEYGKTRYHDLQVHGGLDVNALVRRDNPFVGKISSQKNERHYVQCIIDLLYYALLTCKEEIRNKFPRMAFIASELRQSYSGFRPTLRTILNAKSHRSLNNPMYSDFRKTLDYAEILLKKNSLKNSEESVVTNKISGYLLDISALWEIYLEKLLSRSFPEWNVSAQVKMNLYEGAFFARSNYPDIVMVQGDRIIILDAKFKHMNFENTDVDRNDLFQIQSYAGYYREQEKDVVLCGLIYPLSSPYNKDKSFTSLYGLQNSKTKFIVGGIYVSDDQSVADIDKAEREFIRQIREAID